MVTPVPIPNTEVKHLSADNTWLATARESKSLPDLYGNLKPNSLRFSYVCKYILNNIHSKSLRFLGL